MSHNWPYRALMGSVFVVIASIALAQVPSGPIGPQGSSIGGSSLVIRPPSTNATYVGPGDVLSGAKMWWGFRGYNASYAAPGNNPAITIARASDSSTLTLNILANGKLDLSGLPAFQQTDATCQGTIGGGSPGAPATPAVLTLTSCVPALPSTLGEVVTGAGILPGTYIADQIGQPAGSYRINKIQTVSSPVTVTLTTAMRVTKAFDQTGNGFDAVQATTVNQPWFIPNCENNLPCMSKLDGGTFLVAPTITTINDPFSASAVGLTYEYSVSEYAIVGTGSQTYFAFNNLAADQITVTASGTKIDGSQTSFQLHALTGVWNGVSSAAYVDGTTAATGTTGTANLTGVHWGSNFNTTQAFGGEYMEAGIWTSAIDASQAALCHNQRGYWGPISSC